MAAQPSIASGRAPPQANAPFIFQQIWYRWYHKFSPYTSGGLVSAAQHNNKQQRKCWPVVSLLSLSYALTVFFSRAHYLYFNYICTTGHQQIQSSNGMYCRKRSIESAFVFFFGKFHIFEF